MDRQEYIKLAQSAASKWSENEFDWNKVEWKDSDLIKYDESKYIPFAYVLYFGANGKPYHSVRIRDIKANSWVEAGLDKIKKVEEQIK